jgi:iron complex transport system substrate-binding protein
MEYLGELERAGIPIALLSFHAPETMVENIEKLGYILDEMEKVNEYLEWHDRNVNAIKTKVSGIPEDKKPKVLIEHGGTTTSRQVPSKGAGLHQYCEEAGGISITAELVGKEVEVAWILEQKPDVIVGYDRKGRGGYEPDVTVFKAYHEEIIALPGFKNITAVRDGRVHIIFSGLTGGPGYFVTHAYFAKWFHPDLDLDPQAIHQEYIDKFCGIDFNVREQGVFVYPEPS